MRRRFFVFLVIGILTVLPAACGRAGQSSGQPSSASNREESGASGGEAVRQTGGQTRQAGEKPHAFYTMPDREEDIAALLFLGGRDEAEAGTAAVKKAYFSGLSDGWLEGTERVETEEWQEIYLLLPKYPGVVITIQELDVEELPAATLLTTERPVLLHCNRSDVVPSTQVTVHYGDREITFKPHISLRDGGCEAAQGIYTEVFRGY